VANAQCPNCRSELPDTRPFPSWCPQCSWQLEPTYSMIEWTGGPLARRADRVRSRFARKQFEAMLALPTASLGKRWSFGKAAGFAIAALVNLFPAALFLFGLWVIIAHWPAAWAMFWGALVLVIASILGYRRRPQLIDTLDRSEAPNLFALVDTVADAIGAKRARWLMVTPEFGAAYADVGRFRRQPIVIIGLALWSVLSPQERVAVLSHEFAHGTNRDSLNHGFLGRAVGRLATLAGATGVGLSDVWEIVLIPILIPVSMMFRGLAYLMFYLMSHRSQESEFLADFRGSTIAGTDASIGALRKLGLGHYMYPVVEPIAFRLPGHDGNFFPAFRRLTEQLPPLEHDRQQRITDAETFEKSGDHPPRWARIQFLEHHRVPPGFTPDPALMAAVDAELAKKEGRLTRSLVAAFFPHH
jgi:Zn-dependent protease with chaperone function